MCVPEIPYGISIFLEKRRDWTIKYPFIRSWATDLNKFEFEKKDGENDYIFIISSLMMLIQKKKEENLVYGPVVKIG